MGTYNVGTNMQLLFTM